MKKYWVAVMLVVLCTTVMAAEYPSKSLEVLAAAEAPKLASGWTSSDKAWVKTETGWERKSTSKNTHLFYNTLIAGDFTMQMYVTPSKVRVGDGKGVHITCKNGDAYFMTLGDDKAFGIYYRNGKTGRMGYLTSVKSRFRAKKGVRYKITYTFTEKRLYYELEDPEGNIQTVDCKARLVYPLRLSLHCQRTGAKFDDVTDGEPGIEEDDPRLKFIPRKPKI